MTDTSKDPVGRPYTFSVMPTVIFRDPRLSLVEKCVWMRINSFRPCFATNAWLAAELGIALATVKRAISALVEFGLLESTVIRKGLNGKTRRTLRAIEPLVDDNSEVELEGGRDHRLKSDPTIGSNSTLPSAQKRTEHISSTRDSRGEASQSSTSPMSESDEISSKGKKEPTPYKEIIGLFVELAPTLPKPLSRTSARDRAMDRFWIWAGSMECVRGIFQSVGLSPFLSGRSGEWRNCSFDWVINLTNAAKINEGNYDAKRGVRS